jgi:peptidoglycan/xylan/chitin deacetylase (PgdA/CDA1 family)
VVLAGAAILLPMATAGAAAGATAPRVYHDVRTTDKVIAITIDDGYSADTCLRMARTLRTTGATATFFPVGAAVRAHPKAWRSIAADFPIANHTNSHPLLVNLSHAGIVREIKRQATSVAAITGVAVLPYLRPPGGSWSEHVRQAAGAAGIKALIIWDTTAADTALHSSPAAMLRTALRGGPGSILLMHCNRSVSATLLPGIIKGYRARGFRFVTVEQLITRSWPRTTVTREALADPPSGTLRGTSEGSGDPWLKGTSSSSGARRTRSAIASSSGASWRSRAVRMHASR